MGDEMDKRFEGVWRIEEMEVWGDDSLNLLGPANITFDDDGLGSFQFIAVVGFMTVYLPSETGNRSSSFRGKGMMKAMTPAAEAGPLSKVMANCAGASSFTARTTVPSPRNGTDRRRNITAPEAHRLRSADAFS